MSNYKFQFYFFMRSSVVVSSRITIAIQVENFLVINKTLNAVDYSGVSLVINPIARHVSSSVTNVRIVTWFPLA